MGNHAVYESAAIVNQSNDITSFLQIFPVSIRKESNGLNAYAFLDSGSTVSFIDQSVQEKFQAQSSSNNKEIAFKGALA